ncbi:MAG: choice-of-anchor Q domain-containing protein [Anaerolineae bacterium]
MYRTTLVRLFVLFLLVLLYTTSSFAPIAHAAGVTITVNTLTDETTTNGSCSLREALTNANNNAQTYPDCAAGSGADTINFSVSGTITLGSALPSITDDVTIDGSGQSITVSGADAYQVLFVNVGKTLSLTNLTIAHGSANAGGGVQNDGTLNVTNGAFTSNSANLGGGIWNAGTLTITGTNFSYNSAKNGGAIENDTGVANITGAAFGSNQATCNTTNCKAYGGALVSGYQLTAIGNTFSLNAATCTGTTCLASGGGIYNTATASISNSTFGTNTTSANGSAATGGGIYSSTGSLTVSGSTFLSNSASDGGGIFALGTATVFNSTFYSNTATEGGGIDNALGALTVNNSTFYSNSASVHGGGIFGVQSTTLQNTIVANSTAGGDCYKFSGTFTANSSNLADDSSCDSATQKTLGQLALSSLNSNGGPTQTIALLSGSAAIDAGDDSVCTDVNTVNSVDQRGVARPQGAHCDVGAFEASFITGQKFQDNNGDGFKNGADSGLSGWTIDLKNGFDQLLTSTTTDASGNYTFTIRVLDYTYRVREEQQSGWTQTTANPADLNLTVNTPGASNVNFGNFQNISISGKKFNDLNGDGVDNDGANDGLSGWTINLENASDQVISTTVTGANGAFSFANLGPKTYRLREVPQTGWVQRTANPADLAVQSGNNVTGVLFGNVYATDVSIVKTYVQNANGSVTFTLTVKNAGPGAAANVMVSDTVPAYWRYASASTSQGTCSYNSTTTALTCQLGAMNSNASAKVTLTILPLTSSGSFRNCANVTNSAFDLNPNNNQSCVSRQ